ncbi:MAG: hypothetical protein V4631_22085 [Pseudomonadota bacterium]
MGPIDYSGAFAEQTPQDALLGGLKIGSAFQDMQLKRQQAEAAALQKKQMADDMGALYKDPTPENIARTTLKYPQLSEGFKRSFDMLEPLQRQEHLNQLTQVGAALQHNRMDVAEKLMRDQAAGLRNAGKEREATATEAMLDTFKMDPTLAKITVGKMLAATAGPEKYAASMAALGGEQRADDQAPAELARKKAEAVKAGVEANVATATAPAVVEKATLGNAELRSQMDDRTKRFALDQDKFQTETEMKMAELKQKHGELPEFVSKDVNTAATEAIAARQSGQRMTDLAAQLEAKRDSMGSGATARLGEFWKGLYGSQNELSRLRSEYTRIVTPAALGAYKQVTSGTTSDRDIETAMKGVPADTADPEQMISFLKGTAKLQKYDELLQNAKSEWLASVRSLSKAKADTEIDGVKVPAGMSFKQFTDQYLARKVNQETVQSRSYMKYNTAPQTGGASGDY